MSSGEAEGLETLVARFLDRNIEDAELTPEAFAAELGVATQRREEVLAAIRRALAIAAAFQAAGAELPQAIGKHRVLREIGRGGAGVVYEVEHDQRRLALKRISGAALGPSGLERFRREARLLARLEHPGVVRVVDSGSEAGDAWLAMELVEGMPLSTLARQGALEPRRAARITCALARAVAAVHAAGVVHRDLKPENVILAEGDRPVLVDFGLGAAQDEASLTATGALLGTPRYMAPEQARGEPADRRTDVYALGLILWELIAGAPARSGTARTTLLRDVIVRPVRARRPGGLQLDAGLARLLAAALAHEPEARLAEASEFADDLERWLAGEPVHARPPGARAHLRSFVRRRPSLAGGAALALVGLLAFGVLGLQRLDRAAHAASAANERINRALAALVLGDEPSARAEAEAALREDPRSQDAKRLIAAPRLAPDEPPASQLLARAALRPASLPALALAAERARTEHDGEHAVRELEALIARAPDLAPAWLALAAALIERGDIEPGLEAARGGLVLAGNASDRDGELPRMLARTPDAGAVRAALEKSLARDPDDAALWFALGWTLDAMHEIETAERAYRNAASSDPGHIKTRLCLAHLYSGAQLGVCAGCERAYTRWPALHDPERAVNELLDALALDCGASESVVGRTLETALALGRSTGSRTPLERMLQGLEHCQTLGPPSPQAAARLADARTRLEGALGR